MDAKVGVITPCSRPDTVLKLMSCMQAQTYKNFQHYLIWDGDIPQKVSQYSFTYQYQHIAYHNTKSEYPGTYQRNLGIVLSSGCDYLVFADDDDYLEPTYLSTLMAEAKPDVMSVVQMAVRSNKVSIYGIPDKYVAVPIKEQPIVRCQIGTPCMCIPRSVCAKILWKDEPDHDWKFYQDAVEVLGKDKVVVTYTHQIVVDKLKEI
jgi:glycosyltransferase involved in cell wall biosynthesis